MRLVRAFLGCALFILAPWDFGTPGAQAKEYLRDIVYFSYGVGLWETDGTISGTFQVGGAGLNNGVADLTSVGNELLFNGGESSGLSGLWVTDGTAAGTYEVGGPHNAGVSGASPGGLRPQGPPGDTPQFVTFGNKALFSGYDSTECPCIWVTDGTAAGTTEIGGLGNRGIAGQYFNGSAPFGFTALGNKVFFSAVDTYEYGGLWVTDGTTAGTTEVGGPRNAGIRGAAGPGSSFGPTDFTVFGNKMLFEAFDHTGAHGIWVTDGTAAGTIEISYAGNASDFTVVGDKVYWNESDGLWVTDGTAAGTIEIGGYNSYGIPGHYPYPLEPYQIAAFGNNLLFQGFDSTGSRTLWVSDGTVGGTVEIGGLNNAGVNGPVGLRGLFPYTIVSIGNKALFVGTDASNQMCLWVTDGTAAGTTEIGGIDNAGIPGAPAGGLAPNSMIQSGQKAFLSEPISLGLWVSDGTVAGTYKLENSGDLQGSITPATVWRTDTANFFGGQYSGILWQNATSGQIAIWNMAGTTALSTGTLGSNAGPAWQAAATGDFTNDGFSDILLQNKTTGQLAIWEMNGTTVIGAAPVGGALGPAWKAVATGDFNHDGFADILLQNTTTGQLAIWEMNGTEVIGAGLVGGALGPGWKAAATGDFNNDGYSDILLQNTTNGQLAIWEMNGTNVIGGALVGGSPGSTWKAVATGDFNADGYSDILLQNTATSQVAVWEMNGTNIIGGAVVGTPGTSWQALSADDFKGDGYSDILLQNPTTGQAIIWEMRGTGIIGGAAVGGPGPGWQAIRP